MTFRETQRRLAGRRRGRGLALGVALTALGVGALWWQRAPLATQLIDRELARRGVPASYAIARLSTGGATLAGVVIGDPATPDLVASRVQVDLTWGLGGARIGAVALEDTLVRGRLDSKGLSLGTLDLLRPAPSGGPFSLPDLDLRLRNVRMMLATPGGVVGLAAEGSGNLANGFNGRAALSAPRFQMADCRVAGTRGLFNLMAVDRVVELDGRVRTIAASCGEVQAGRGAMLLSTSIPETMDAVEGRIDAAVRRLAYKGGSIARTRLNGGFNLAPAKKRFGFDGALAWSDLVAPGAWGAALKEGAGALAGLPPGPVAARIAAAGAGAMRRSRGSAQMALSMQGATGRASLSNLRMRSASGAALTATGRAFSFNWPEGTPRLDGRAVLSGGGLPDMRLDVGPAPDGWRMLGSVAPYSAGTARLVVGPWRLDWRDNSGRLLTELKMDGPLGHGFVKALAVPVDLRFGPAGAVRLMASGGCTTAGFDRLELAGVLLGQERLRICAQHGETLFAADAGGRLSGGMKTRLAFGGRLGAAPLSVDAEAVRIGFGGSTAAPRVGLALGPAALALKQPDGETRLDLTELTAEAGRDGLRGSFGGASGRIVNVPLRLDQAEGRWTYGGGVLGISAPSARIRDAADERRFEPVSARDVKLALEDGVIRGDAIIARPKDGRRLALVSLTHNLSEGSGKADLDVPRLVFGDDLQPEELTPLTLGVIANVGGAIEGGGQIRWSPEGVTSDGAFESDGIGLSAAFGQVHNIKGRIVFDDLLGMSTPPGQVATIGEMNPGVSVKDGVIRYELLPDQHVKVEEGRWPFAGGELVLEPTLLDFSKPSDRIFTLRVEGLDAAQFIQQFDFRNFAVTGLFDGRLPLLFNADGGRIVGGRLIARSPGGTLAYVGEVSEADIGGAGKLAFDALKSLKYNALIIEMDGQLDGEIISTVLFNGSNQQPVNPTGSSLPVKATGLPFKFNITIRAPFRALLNTAESFTDVRTTVRQAAPVAEDAEQGGAPVQPPDSQ